MRMKTETKLRNILKEVYGKQIVFVESGKGGTDGYCDARIMGINVNLELKAIPRGWKLDEKGNTKRLGLRPAQCAFARRCNEYGEDWRLVGYVKDCDREIIYVFDYNHLFDNDGAMKEKVKFHTGMCIKGGPVWRERLRELILPRMSSFGLGMGE